jgi:cytochrome c-type biogenesis protein CcmH
MTLWLVFALMTAAAIFAVLWPLSRTARMSGGSDVAVYRDQLDEIERDRAAGLIGGAEAQAARTEVSRRLLAATGKGNDAQRDPAGALWRRRAAAVAALVVVPLIGAGVYLRHGSPHLPGEPLAERQGTKIENLSLAESIARVEARLSNEPNDGRGWEVIAPIYLRLGRFDDSVRAYRNALRLNGETAARQADLGEALVAAANGVVTADAKQSFDRALTLDPRELKSRFYTGVAAEQDGARGKAAEIWRAMLREAPPDAPWAPAVRQALAEIGEATESAPSAPPAAGPSAADIASASGLSEAERAEMVQGMVARLADRLRQDGSDVEGWLRLVRAYMVLGDRDKANQAAGEARRALASDPDKLRKINDVAKGLGLDG